MDGSDSPHLAMAGDRTGAILPRGSMGHVKGSAIASRVHFVRARYGQAGLAEVLGQMSRENAVLLSRETPPAAWVPFSVFVELNVTADRVFGAGDLGLCLEMGRYGAEQNLPTLYKLFYRLGTPQYILSRAARLWDVHYDSGRLRLEDAGPRAMRMRIEGFDQPHRSHCLSVLGWTTRSIEMSGGKLLTFGETRCRTFGDSVCELVADWE